MTELASHVAASNWLYFRQPSRSSLVAYLCCRTPLFAARMKVLGTFLLGKATADLMRERSSLYQEALLPLREQLEAFDPDHQQLAALHDGSVIKGLIVTLKGHLTNPAKGTDDQDGLSKYDFVSRYFAVWNGIPEDPVTGEPTFTLLGFHEKHLLTKATLMLVTYLNLFQLPLSLPIMSFQDNKCQNHNDYIYFFCILHTSNAVNYNNFLNGGSIHLHNCTPSMYQSQKNL